MLRGVGQQVGAAGRTGVGLADSDPAVGLHFEVDGYRDEAVDMTRDLAEQQPVLDGEHVFADGTEQRGAEGRFGGRVDQ